MAGCGWLHVVDLNGAFAGRAVNARRRRGDPAPGRACRCSSAAAFATWRRSSDGSGPACAGSILGSAAVKNPDLVRQACRSFPGRIVVGIDARDGLVATEGWAETSGMRALDLARRFEDAGVAAIVYTDIGRDGMLAGLNLEQTLDLAAQLATPVIASGGVGQP